MVKKILVSQPRPASDKSPYYDIEKEYGVECVFRPFFKVEGLTAKEFRQQKINFNWNRDSLNENGYTRL